MHLCYTNAYALIEEAEMLLPHNPGRSLSFGILALEETAKIFILCEAAAVACIEGSISWSKVSKVIRSHRTKQSVIAEYGRKLLSKAKPFYETELPQGVTSLLDKMKQLGFYVDCFDGEFMGPKEFGTRNLEWVEWVIDVAKERVESIRKLHETEEASIKFALDAGALAAAASKSKEDFTIALKDLITRKRLNEMLNRE